MQPSSSTRATIVSAENQNGATIVKATFFFCHYYIVWESNNAGEARGQSWNESLKSRWIPGGSCGYTSGTKRKHFAALSSPRPCWRWLQLQPSCGSPQWHDMQHKHDLEWISPMAVELQHLQQQGEGPYLVAHGRPLSLDGPSGELPLLCTPAVQDNPRKLDLEWNDPLVMACTRCGNLSFGPWATPGRTLGWESYHDVAHLHAGQDFSSVLDLEWIGLVILRYSICKVQDGWADGDNFIVLHFPSERLGTIKQNKTPVDKMMTNIRCAGYRLPSVIKTGYNVGVEK